MVRAFESPPANASLLHGIVVQLCLPAYLMVGLMTAFAFYAQADTSCCLHCYIDVLRNRVGRFLGYCLWTGEAVNMPLLPSVYSYLLDKELNWRDMMLDAPKVYTSYMQMLAMAPDEVEFLCFVGVIVHHFFAYTFFAYIFLSVCFLLMG